MCCTATTRTASGSSGRRARTGSARRSAAIGQPGPKYVAYVDPGPPDKRVIAQLNHELDIIHDTSAEGMFTLAKQSKTSRGWFKGFPYAHPDPTLPSVIFNHHNELFKDKRVRWALALLIDIKAVSMASYRGAATISAIAIPPTGTHTESYHAPMEAWLKDFELDTGKRKIKPYNPNIGKEIADMLRPSMGDQIPTSADDIAKSFGRGWWKPDPQAATELLQAAGFTKRGNDWLTPDGKPFTVRIVVEGDLRPVMTRAGSMIAQQWRQFGIDAKTDVAQGTLVDRRNGGGFRHHHLVERRDLGRASRTCRSSSTAGTRSSSRRPARCRRRATGSAGPRPSSTRSSSRSAPSASTIRRASSWAASS